MNPLPYATRIGWVTLPIEMIRAFRGRSCLPVYECNENYVREPHRRVLSTAQPKECLSFSAWQLAHAVKKADCSRWPSPRILWPGAAGFLLENIHLFDWGSRPLRLHSGMSDFYADFSRTGLSGRIGQGMALLFLEERGYSYVGRFSTIFKQYGGVWGRKKSPDFIVENGRKEWALAEAKGGFVSPCSSSRIKYALGKALDQLTGWGQCFSPPPHKGFAIGTFLREIGGTHEKSSLTAFVDMDMVPGGPQAPSGETRGFPPDATRRANYASWLSLMGFDDAARRLRERKAGSERRSVPLLTLEGRRYAVAITSIRPSYRHHADDRDFLRLVQEKPDGISIELAGLDLCVVRMIEVALREPGSCALMEIQPGERRDIAGEEGEFRGSVFSDGSLIGEIGVSDLKWFDHETDKVTL